MGKTFLAIKLSEFLVLRDKGGEGGGGGGVGGDGGVGGGEGGKETETKFQPSRKVYALKTNHPIGASWRFTSRPLHTYITFKHLHTYTYTFGYAGGRRANKVIFRCCFALKKALIFK